MKKDGCKLTVGALIYNHHNVQYEKHIQMVQLSSLGKET
jgi:hypothetical protein